jgi:hypothetical protein
VPDVLDLVNDAVAAELRAAAARKGISGAQVARNLDLPPMYAHRRFSASVDITVTDLVRICRGIQVEPLDVLAQVLTAIEDVPPPAAERTGT